jgi:DNA replication and repair protein RecF
MARGKAIETLDVWDGHLTDFGGQLLAARLQLVADLGPHMAAAYAEVAGEGSAVAGLGYTSTVPLAGGGTAVAPGAPVPSATELSSAMRERIGERRGDELDRGMTLVGPHRDDLVIHLGPAPAKGFASHGESWSLALALKLATFALLRGEGEDPILILDDVFATLDAERRAALAAVAASAEQTLITAAVLEDVPPELRGARVEVGGGYAVLVKDAVPAGEGTS